MLQSCPHDHYLSLYKYVSELPECFFSEEAFQKYLAWLESFHSSSEKGLKRYFEDHTDQFNKAFLFLSEINQASWHDFFEELDDYEKIRIIDQQIHPAYLRLIEAVLYPFCHLSAFFCRIDRGKGTDDLDVVNAVEEVQNTELSIICESYKKTVRNGIAHGGITYLEDEIVYRDKKGNEEKLSAAQTIRLVDDLIDVCNGMSLATKVFMFSHLVDGYALPQQILLEELQAETDTPYWHIVGCTPSKFESLSQLIIYARPDSGDMAKIRHSTICSGVFAEFFAPGYERYFISLRGPKALPGWAAFDGNKLLEARNKFSQNIVDYSGILENNTVFYVPKNRVPEFLSRLDVFRIASRIDTFFCSLKIHWPLALADFREKLGQPEIHIRSSRIHRNGRKVVLRGAVVIVSNKQPLDQELVRTACKRIIKAALSNARKDWSLMSPERYLPLGFARVSIFQRNYRKRRLDNYGLGPDLIATIQIKHIKKIRSPDIIGATIEIKGKHRIAWNRAWLKENIDG